MLPNGLRKALYKRRSSKTPTPPPQADALTITVPDDEDEDDAGPAHLPPNQIGSRARTASASPHVCASCADDNDTTRFAQLRGYAIIRRGDLLPGVYTADDVDQHALFAYRSTAAQHHRNRRLSMPAAVGLPPQAPRPVHPRKAVCER